MFLKQAFGDGQVKMTFKAAGPVLLFHKELQSPEGGSVVSSSMSATQQLFDPNDSSEEKDGETIDKYIHGDLLTHRVYGCRVVLTNSSSAQQRVELLLQVPHGAVPVGGVSKPVSQHSYRGGRHASPGFYTHTVVENVEGFNTSVVDYFFYFPRAGTFAHFPAHVSKNGTVVAAASSSPLQVVDSTTAPRPLDLTSWRTVSQDGTNEQVLKFLLYLEL